MGRHGGSGHITYARSMKVDYSRFSLGGLHGKHVVEIWGEKGNHSSICSRTQENQKKTKKNLFRDGRSQDLPVTDF
jgi:hypothetical protein